MLPGRPAAEPIERDVSPAARYRLMSSAIVAVPLNVSVSPSSKVPGAYHARSSPVSGSSESRKIASSMWTPTGRLDLRGGGHELEHDEAEDFVQADALARSPDSCWKLLSASSSAPLLE